MVFKEPPDPLSGKGKNHEAAATSKIVDSGSRIEPNPMDLLSRFNALYGTVLKSSSENIKQKWEGISPIIKTIFGRIVSKTHTSDDVSTLIYYIEVIEEDIALSKSESVIEEPKKVVVTPPVPVQIPTLTPIIPSSKSQKVSYKGKGTTYKLSPYEEKCRKTLLALGTKNASEWDVIGSGYDEQGTTCQLCGHRPIKNIYVIEKIKGDNIGTTLEIGSECVLNYLGIPMAVVDFNLIHNKDKGFIKKMDKLLEILKGD